MNPIRRDAWAARAGAAMVAFKAADVGALSAMALSYATRAAANTDGWQSASVAGYLARLRALRNPDGSYGLNATADAFQDGTTNPATTAYTASMAHHAGPTLLEGWLADPGIVPATEVQQQVTCLLAMHRFTTATGVCLAYSNSPNDWTATYRVANANAAAAAFLWRCRGYGFTGVPAVLVGDQIRDLTATYKPAWKGWAYSAAVNVAQDPDHQSVTAECVHALVPWMGRESAYGLMWSTGTAPLDPLAHMRLVALPGGDDGNSMSTTEPDQTIWLVKGDEYLTEFDAFIAAQAGVTDRLAQAWHYAVLNWLAASA